MKALADYCQAHYDDYYKDGPSEWRRIGAVGKVDNIVNLCGSVAHESILDIGAGEGAVIQRLSDVGFGGRFCALEISASGVDVIAQRRIANLSECRLFDGYAIPYADDAFDLAVLSHVIEHVEHPRALLRESARVAKHLFVEVPLEDNARLSWDYVADQVGHINFFSAKTVRRFVQTCSLEVLEQRIVNPLKAAFVFSKGRKGIFAHAVKQLANRTVPILAAKIFTYHCALLCRKSAPGAPGQP